MNSTNAYRVNAEECLRIAKAAHTDRPFWLSLAQSWLHLAERSARGADAETEQPRQVPCSH
jgi:plasmid maintenance system antidote protein VapI